MRAANANGQAWIGYGRPSTHLMRQEMCPRLDARRAAVRDTVTACTLYTEPSFRSVGSRGLVGHSGGQAGTGHHNPCGRLMPSALLSVLSLPPLTNWRSLNSEPRCGSGVRLTATLTFSTRLHISFASGLCWTRVVASRRLFFARLLIEHGTR